MLDYFPYGILYLFIIHPDPRLFYYHDLKLAQNAMNKPNQQLEKCLQATKFYKHFPKFCKTLGLHVK
jgi:hypothetical protein